MPCKHKKEGFTLVEVMIVVAIIGVLASLAIYGVKRYLASAMTSEAKSVLGGVGRGAIVVFEASSPALSELLPDGDESNGDSATFNRWPPCWRYAPCPPIPWSPPKGTKYQPISAPGKDYQHPCWQCLHFANTQPQVYQYQYTIGSNYVGPTVGGPDPGPDGVEIAARGDVDGDGVFSTFTLPITWNATTKSPRMASQIFIHDEFE